jgi:hypothetical protein
MIYPPADCSQSRPQPQGHDVLDDTGIETQQPDTTQVQPTS